MDSLTQCSIDTSIIGVLATDSESRGLEEQEFKDKFDQFGLECKTYLNDTLLPDIKTKVDADISALNTSLTWESLHNTDFINPINQDEVSGTISTLGYFIDRWKLTSGTVTLTSNGLQLNGTIVQIMEKAIDTTTLPHLEMYSGTATASYDKGTKTLSITSSGGVIKYVNKPFTDRSAELLKCQRFLRVICGHAQGTDDYFTGGNYVLIRINKLNMRIAPTVTLIGTANDANGYYVAPANGGTAMTGVAFTCGNFSPDAIWVKALKSGITASRDYVFVFNANTKIRISAEL